MDNFIFSVNVTFPIFLVMVIGWALKEIGMLDEHFVKVANRFNFKVTLPVLLFRDLSATDIRGDFDLKFVIFCALATTVCFWGIWFLTKMFLKDKSMRGAFVQASFRSSVAVMGMAFIGNIYGSSAMGPLMLIGAVPLYNIYSVLVLTFEARPEEAGAAGGVRKSVETRAAEAAGKEEAAGVTGAIGNVGTAENAREEEAAGGAGAIGDGGTAERIGAAGDVRIAENGVNSPGEANRVRMRQACVNIMKNPIIIGILLGTLFAFFKIDLPEIADRTVDSVAKMATPLALISLGAGFEGRKALAKIRPTLWAAAIKLILQSAVLLPVAVALGFEGEKLLAVLIMLASPATPSCYIMAKNMRNDGTLTASIIVMTTLLAAFTLTGWIWLLKTLGLL